MSKELNCMNCCIGDFKHSLCDCDNGMCKEYKKVGRAEDFENEVMNRTKPKTGECETCKRNADNGGFYDDGRTRCPIQEHYALPKDGYCHLYEPRMRGEEE